MDPDWRCICYLKSVIFHCYVSIEGSKIKREMFPTPGLGHPPLQELPDGVLLPPKEKTMQHHQPSHFPSWEGFSIPTSILLDDKTQVKSKMSVAHHDCGFFLGGYMGVSKNRGTPKWMVYNGNPYENGWFRGTTIFGNTHINGWCLDWMEPDGKVVSLKAKEFLLPKWPSSWWTPKDPSYTPPKINMEPENGGLEDDFPFQTGDFQVPC